MRTFVIFSLFSLSLIFGNAVASVTDCPKGKESACHVANKLAMAMGNEPSPGSVRPHVAKLTFLSVQARGPVLETTARMPLLVVEMLDLDKITGGRYLADWEKSNQERARASLCPKSKVELFNQLLAAGGAIRNVFLSLDDVVVTTVNFSDCSIGPIVNIPRRTFELAAEKRHERVVKWESKKNLYIYDEEPLGCYFSEYGTVLSPWGNRVAETHSRWSHPDSMEWASRTTYSANGEFATYFHFKTEEACKKFQAQARKRSR